VPFTCGRSADQTCSGRFLIGYFQHASSSLHATRPSYYVQFIAKMMTITRASSWILPSSWIFHRSLLRATRTTRSIKSVCMINLAYDVNCYVCNASKFRHFRHASRKLYFRLSSDVGDPLGGVATTANHVICICDPTDRPRRVGGAGAALI
jgi:hypothetical protein